ncbi:MAG: tetratricopeptide repeat protein, partial [Bacteroidota bacterium]
MKYKIIILILICITRLSIYGQQNNVLRGKILFLNSGKKPAVGVKISGSVEGQIKANHDYSSLTGAFQLTFQEAREGYQVELIIGEEDGKGQLLEVVNIHEIGLCKIPAKSTEEFEIIVCPKGSRDLIAQQYYQIIKTSADQELEKKKQELKALIEQKREDYKQIELLSRQIEQLQKDSDSLTIYREAFDIASINKDNASDRVLQYLQLLNKGMSIQEAREVLSIKGAVEDFEKSRNLFIEAKRELLIRARSSSVIFDYVDAITCYDKLIQYLKIFSQDADTLARYISKKAEILQKNSNPEGALACMQEVVEIIREKTSPDSLKFATAYNDLASIHKDLGAYKKALSFQQASVRIKERILNPTHPYLVTSYNSLALIHEALGEYPEADTFIQKAIKIQENTLDSLDLELANTYFNAAIIYRSLTDYERALTYILLSKEIQEKILDRNHPHLGFTYNVLGDLYADLHQYVAVNQGYLAQAFIEHKKAIQILEAALNPNHPSLAIAYNHVARVYQDSGSYDTALVYQLKAVAIEEKALGPNHPALATTYNNIAKSYLVLGNIAYAIDLLLQSTKVKERAYGQMHPSVGLNYLNLSVVCIKAKDFPKAREYLNLSKKIFHSSLDAGHSYFRESEIILGKLYEERAFEFMRKRDYPSALKDLDDAMDYPKYSDDTYGKLWGLKGVCFFEIRKFRRAINAFDKTVSTVPELVDKNYLREVGISYANCKQYDKAFKAFSKYEQRFPTSSVTFQNWIVYYALQGKKTEVFNSLKKAMERG